MEEFDKEKVIELLRNDKEYYDGIGTKFRSNSDIYKLLNDPESFGKPSEQNINFLIGGYFHTAILEPEKLKDNYKVIDASTRNTKAYKEEAGKDMFLLQKEVDRIDKLIAKVKGNEVCMNLIGGDHVEYETPNVIEIDGTWWKGKADIINHDQELIVDLKTTGDISKFRQSAYRYNYDSQAYIYKKLFGYDMVFLAVCKKTGQIGVYDCSDEFYESGRAKVSQAMVVYEQTFGDPLFDLSKWLKHETL